MIAVDACVLISFLQGENLPEVEWLERLLLRDEVILAPSTVTELLSDPKGGDAAADLVADMKILPIDEGFWHRAGRLRAAARRSGRKAALGGALLAQACLDSDVALLTCDSDFRAFAKVAGLRLAE